MGVKYEGWTNGGKVESVASALVIALMALADVLVLEDHFDGSPLPEIVLMALMALNVVGLAVAIHLGKLSRARRGYWLKTYPLSDTTVLDAVMGYMDEQDMTYSNIGERHAYTDSFSDVFRCKRPWLEVRVRPVRFLGKGVSLHVGPKDKANEEALYGFLDNFDDFIERDLLEGLPGMKKVSEEE
jgi:hypothetical protein